jgi:hypothetical protein
MSVPMANKRISSDHINLRDALFFASGYACRYTLSCVRVWPRLCENKSDFQEWEINTTIGTLLPCCSKCGGHINSSHRLSGK